MRRLPDRSSTPFLATAAEVVLLLAFPLLAFYAVHFGAIHQNYMLDPYLYTGYIYNFHDLWARYGVTYYGVRFGLILPARFFTTLFGVEGGYFVFRYVLALVFGLPLYALVKRRFSAAVAALIYVIALTSPYLARALLWDHPDAAAVPFLTAAICLMLLDPEDLRLALAAGCFFGLAGNCNIFTVAIFGIFLSALGACWLWFHQPPGRLLRSIGVAAAGALSVCGAGAAYYWFATGHLNIFGVTLFMATSLSRGGMDQWRISGFNWTLNLYHVYVPIWLSIVTLLGVRYWRRSLTTAAIALFVIGVTTFYYIHQFFLHADTLQLFYYFSYAAPALFLALALLLQQVYDACGRRPAPFLAAGIGSTAVLWILYSFGRGPLLPPRLLLFSAANSLLRSPLQTVIPPGADRFLFAAFCSAVLLAVLLLWRPKSAPLALAALLLVGWTWDTGFGVYGSTIQSRSNPDAREMEVYRVAHALVDAVPKFDGANHIIFWYNNRQQNSINSLQSTYLWGFSKLNANPPEDPGMPVLNDGQVARLKGPTYRYLGIIAESRDELAAALAAVRGRGIPYTEADRRDLGSGSYHVLWTLLDLRPAKQ